MSKDFRILSLDGGGIRGIYAASILNSCELDLKNKYGQDTKIGDFFDLICGTSTGGIIALAIALRVDMQVVLDLYEKKGETIFHKSNSLQRKLRQLFFRGKYSDSDLKKQLESVFGERTIGEAKNFLCIPTYDIGHGTYEIFKYDHAEGNLSRHNNLKAVEVALATSAAPTFFPVAMIDDSDRRLYIDGGVWANNPSLIGYLEAKKFFVGKGRKFDSIQMLSISSLPTRKGRHPKQSRYMSALDWGGELFDATITAQSEFANIFLESMQSDSEFNYQRLTSKVEIHQHSSILSLDNAEKSAVTLLKQYAADTYHAHKNLPSLKKFWIKREAIDAGK